MSDKSRVQSMLKGWWYAANQMTRYWLRRIALRCGFYERAFSKRTGHFPDYGNPLTLNDKLAWMRRYDHNPLYTQLADKIAVRDYVRERVGDEVLIPQYGVWEKARDIDFDSLPNTFVIKCNHESGFVVVCRDKDAINRTYVRAKIATRLRMNYYYRFLEWPYRNIKPRILAEKLLVDDNGDEAMDYKVHCFDGQPGYIVAERCRRAGHPKGSYSPEWEPMPFRTTESPSVEVARPKQLKRMLEIATELARGLHFCRVDLYVADGQVYFGEITIIPGAGMLRLFPKSYSRYWGDRVTLPGPTDCERNPDE